jgi:Flp pilus assembly protein TadG
VGLRWYSSHQKYSRGKRHAFRLRGLLRGDGGASAVEFAIILPVLLLVLLAIMRFGVVINNQIQIVAGTRASARVLSISRGNTTAYSDSLVAFQNSAPNISVTPTMTVNGTVCTANCATLLMGASGQAIKVSAAMNCNLTIAGFNFAPGCQLSSQTTERAE